MKKAKYVIKNDKGLYYNEFLTYDEDYKRTLRVHNTYGFTDTPKTRFSNKKFVLLLIASLRIIDGEICSIEEVRD